VGGCALRKKTCGSTTLTSPNFSIYVFEDFRLSVFLCRSLFSLALIFLLANLRSIFEGNGKKGLTNPLDLRLVAWLHLGQSWLSVGCFV